MHLQGDLLPGRRVSDARRGVPEVAVLQLGVPGVGGDERPVFGIDNGRAAPGERNFHTPTLARFGEMFNNCFSEADRWSAAVVPEVVERDVRRWPLFVQPGEVAAVNADMDAIHSSGFTFVSGQDLG